MLVPLEGESYETVMVVYVNSPDLPADKRECVLECRGLELGTWTEYHRDIRQSLLTLFKRGRGGFQIGLPTIYSKRGSEKVNWGECSSYGER